jgi:HAD superfamily hydrolase (TIGR01509 family)
LRIPPEAVLFDMDGTLIDSEPIWFDTEIAILAEYGFTLGREHWARVLGQPNEVAVGYLLEVSGIPLTPRQLNERIEDAMAARMGQGIELMAGAKELFTELDAAGIPAALVTASSRRIVEASLGSIGAHRFQFTVSGDDVTHGKPHPEPYLTAARLLGVDPTRCAVIEDSPNGSRSGAAAGCRVLAIPHAAPIAAHPLITVADSLADVSLATLRGLFADADADADVDSDADGGGDDGPVTAGYVTDADDSAAA